MVHREQEENREGRIEETEQEEGLNIIECYNDLEEPLRTLEVGWFRNLSSRQKQSLKKLIEFFKGESLNLNCYNCIKKGLQYVKRKQTELY